jgi:hypothetical protein
MKIGAAPEFRHLHDPLRASLVKLREAVAPILANNLLPHFTDHSVAHSDSVTQLVDQLLQPLKDTDSALNEQELMALYGACYLHDIGMQYENAEATKAIQGLKLTQRWEDLPESTRRDLLRNHHASISAELVETSIRSPTPPIGIQLSPEYEPSSVAALCEAHVLEVESPLYQTLTEPGPRIRMGLISGILRIADILDESRRRATREKAQTLLLNLISQVHWWRHYYTEDITIHSDERIIKVWFDFPPDLAAEYGAIVPVLQVPAIEAELLRHTRQFLPYGYGWILTTVVRGQQYGGAEQMPDVVYEQMQKMIAAQRAGEQGRIPRSPLQQFIESRGYMDRRIDELLDAKTTLPAADFLRQLNTLASELLRLGAKRSAWRILWGEFELGKDSLPESEQLEIGLNLIALMIGEDAGDRPARLMEKLKPIAETLDDSDPIKARFYILQARALASACAYEPAVGAYEKGISLTDAPEVKEILGAELAEMHFLQGEFVRAREVLA